MAEAPKAKTTAVKSTEIVRKVPRLIKAMLAEAHDAKAQGKPVAYCFLGNNCDEIVRAMGIAPVWPENWAGFCAAVHLAEPFLNKASAEGFSDKLCTYATCGLGFDTIRHELGEAPPDAPFGGMPKPDVMIGIGLIFCDARHKWFQAAQRYVDVPLYTMGLLTPPYDVDPNEVGSYYVDYMVEELRGLVEFLEQVTGRKMDWEDLNHRIDVSDETNGVWYEAYQLRKAIPAPMPTQDAMSAFVPGWCLLGTQTALDFCRDLYNEVRYRVENKIGAISEEKYRLLWGMGIPPWFMLQLFNYFETYGAVFPIEAIYRPFEPVEIPAGVSHPLERLAWRIYKRGTYRHNKARNRSGDADVELLIDFIDDYKIDGVVLHRAYSCRTVHTGQLHQLALLKQYRNLPSLLIESDMVDVRSFSEEEIKNKIETFIEIVDAHKRSGKA